ncbi:MAG: hypothetical protein WCD47_00015 [Candidatus Sulfotelmatobacter sp.]
MSEEDGSRNAETEYDPEDRPFPRQVKVSGKKEEKKNQPALHHANASPQDAGRRNEPECRGIRKGGNDRRGKYQNDTNTANQNFRHSTQRRVTTQQVSKNLANHNEFYECFNYQESKRTPPINRSRNRRTNVDYIGEDTSCCLNNCVTEERGKLPVQPTSPHLESKKR